MPPSTTPSPAAIETIQARTLSGVWKPGPSIASAQPSPYIGKPAQQPLQADRQHRDQHQRQPDRAPQDGAHRRRQDLRKRLDGGVQHGGSTSREKPSREVDTPEGFGKGFDKRLPGPGKQDCRQKREVAMTRVQEHLSRQQSDPARGGPARRPAAREDISVDSSQAALDPRRIRRRRAALRGRLVPAGKDLSAIRRRARHHRGPWPRCPAPTASR